MLLLLQRFGDESSTLSCTNCGAPRHETRFLRPDARHKIGTHGRQAIVRSLELMKESVSEPLTLGALATAAGYSRFHFLRLFKAETGQTPHAYLMRYRVEQAKARLRHGEPIADTAYATGFTDQAHLSRRFKALVGMTPGEFVKSNPTRRTHEHNHTR